MAICPECACEYVNGIEAHHSGCRAGEQMVERQAEVTGPDFHPWVYPPWGAGISAPHWTRLGAKGLPEARRITLDEMETIELEVVVRRQDVHEARRALAGAQHRLNEAEQALRMNEARLKQLQAKAAFQLGINVPTADA